MPTATPTNLLCSRTTALRNDSNGTMEVRYVEHPGVPHTYAMGLNLVTLEVPA